MSDTTTESPTNMDYLTGKYKEDRSLEVRKAESARVFEKFSDRVPVIVEMAEEAANKLPYLDKQKYLVPADLTVGQFQYVVRKRIKLKPEEALFLFVGNELPATAELMSDLYKGKKDEDGFLYVVVHVDSAFGA